MTTTLLKLKTQARQRADRVNSNFIEEDELTSYINNSIAELHDLLVSTYGPDYYVESFDFNTVAGTDSYNLPATFYKLKGVDALINGAEYTSLKPFNWNERNRNLITTTETSLMRYRLVGSKLKFNPAPLGSYNVRLWYIPTPTPLVTDADIYNDINSYSEYIITDVAIKMLQKEESDISVLASQKMDLRKRIENMAQNRDADQSESITDIYYESDEW